MEIVLKNLKTVNEYKKELTELHAELGAGIATDTLIADDMQILTRIDELVLLIEVVTNVVKRM